MSRIVTLTDVKKSDETKLKETIETLVNRINDLKINEFKNKRYITALEYQVKELMSQLKKAKSTPRFDLTSILKEINNNTLQSHGLSNKEIEEFDKEIEQKINKLLN